MAVFLPVLQVMVVVTIGFIVGKVFDIQRKTLSSLTLYVFLPAFVFRGLYFSELSYGEMLSLVGANISLTVSLFVITLLIGFILKLPDWKKSALTMGTLFINVHNMGIPVVIFAFGEQAMGSAVVTGVMGTIIINTLGVYIASRGTNNLLDSLYSIMKMPVLYAVVIALTLNALNVELPGPVINPVTLLAGAAIPTILILLGTQLAAFSGINSLPLIAGGSILRLLVSPLLAFLIAFLFGLPQEISRVFITQMAMPTAVNALILAVEFNGDTDTMAGIIFATTVLSVLTLPFWLSFLV